MKNQMKNLLVGLLCVVALLLIPAASYGAPRTQEATPDITTSITVLGYGSASSAPDRARVQLLISERPSFGPGGPGSPGLVLPDSDDLELVRDYLVENGVDGDTIQIDLFSSNFPYGPSNFASEITFTYAELDSLRALLQKLVDELEARPGPIIQSAQVVFLVEDCAALEEAAMQAALDDARQRATRLAGLLDMTRGRVIAVNEDHASAIAIGASGGCIALDGLASFGIDTFLSGSSPLVNTAARVEVGILLKMTFALDP